MYVSRLSLAFGAFHVLMCSPRLCVRNNVDRLPGRVTRKRHLANTSHRSSANPTGPSGRHRHELVRRARDVRDALDRRDYEGDV